MIDLTKPLTFDEARQVWADLQRIDDPSFVPPWSIRGQHPPDLDTAVDLAIWGCARAFASELKMPPYVETPSRGIGVAVEDSVQISADEHLVKVALHGIAKAAASAPANTVQVRIAVAANEFYHWEAVGSSAYENSDEAAERATDSLPRIDSGVKVTFVEAIVQLPRVETVQGRVEEAK